MEATDDYFSIYKGNMTTSQNFHWTSTDDTHTAPENGAVQLDGISNPGNCHTNIHQSAPSKRGMQLAAVAGIGTVVMIGFGLSFGLESLRGSLLNESAVKVTITADGHFAPSQVTVHPGDILTIESKKTDPQVLSPKDPAAELFGMEVVFGDPFTFTVPENAVLQSYQYHSETLSPEEMLTITVTEAPKNVANSPTNIQAPTSAPKQQAAPIDTAPPASNEVLPPIPGMDIPLEQSTNNTLQPTTLSLGLTTPVPAVTPAPATTKTLTTLPTNNNTVATKKAIAKEIPAPLKKQARIEKKALHAAAMPESGNADWVLLSMALIAFGIVCKRSLSIA